MLKKVSEPSWASEVKALRSAECLTQEEFAAKIGVSKSTLVYWESGQFTPHKRTMQRVRAAFSPAPSAPAEGASPNRRYSQEAIVALHKALDIILDGAPSTVILKVGEFLDEFAGKYGIPSERGQTARRVLRAIPVELSNEIDRAAHRYGLDTYVILAEAFALWERARSRAITAGEQTKINKEASKRVHRRA